jgi:hypothetical protein
MASELKETIDIQALLTAAAEQLEVGEMLHTEDFSLAAVMSAAEIGDARLDAGKLQHSLFDQSMHVSSTTLGSQVLTAACTNSLSGSSASFHCRYGPESARRRHG